MENLDIFEPLIMSPAQSEIIQPATCHCSSSCGAGAGGTCSCGSDCGGGA